MERIKVLLADDDAVLLNAMGEYMSRLGSIDVVGKLCDGSEIMDAVTSLIPDIIVMDLVLPRRDGFMVMEQLSRLHTATRPKIIVLTALARNDLILKAVRLGAAYYMVKPFDMQIICDRVTEIARESIVLPVGAPPAPHEYESADEKITNLFLTLGIPAHIKGYQYLREAVLMVMSDRSLINCITKELYPGVAKKCDTTASKVERAMRHAIEVAWNRGRLDTVNDMYGYKVFEKRDKPTNGEFIALVSAKITEKITA